MSFEQKDKVPDIHRVSRWFSWDLLIGTTLTCQVFNYEFKYESFVILKLK